MMIYEHSEGYGWKKGQRKQNQKFKHEREHLELESKQQDEAMIPFYLLEQYSDFGHA